MTGPLEGLRVLELATGIAGPYAGRLLAMLGATVVKVEPPEGDSIRDQPVQLHPPSDLSPLHVHLNAGKRLVRESAAPLERAVAWADVVIAGAVRRGLAGGPLDPIELEAGATSPPLVTTSAWGFEAEDPGTVTDELLVQAASGAMTTTGDPDGPPLRLPGFQAQYMAGAYVAAAALAALHRPDTGHVDVPWVACMASGVEGGFSRNLQTDRGARGGGPHQLDVFPSGALPCADGHVVPGTIRPSDWVAQCAVYDMPELLQDERFRSRRRRRENHRELWSVLEPWYRANSRVEIFTRALESNWALGMVLRASDAHADPHLRERGFLHKLELPGGRSARAPARPWLAPEVTGGRARLADAGEDDGWFARHVDEPATHSDRQPLESVRILELTQAWAGPFVGRFLGALGADVVKVESKHRPDGWRGPSTFREAAPHVGRDPDELSVEIAPNFNALNRNKRHCSIDLRQPEGRALFLELVAAADVVVANMTARVLPALELDYPVLRAANERIILINMPALGATGPYRDAAGYGTIVEGMGGLGALFGAPEEGARISQTFYPDPVAGVHATLAVLTMLERRDRSGHGGEVDLSHQEALWLQLGESLVAADDGTDLDRIGNRVPGCATSGVFGTRDARWIAVASPVACEDLVAHSAERDCDELLAELRACGARALEVLPFAKARESDALSATIEKVVHDVTLERPYLRVPLWIDGAPLDTRHPCPVFDKHTREVIAEWLGHSTAEIEALLATGAVGGAPDPAELRAFYLGRSSR